MLYLCMYVAYYLLTYVAYCNGFIELASFHGQPDCFNDHPTPSVNFKDHVVNKLGTRADFDLRGLSRIS